MPIIRRTAKPATVAPSRSAVTRPTVAAARRVVRREVQAKVDNYSQVVDKLQLIAIVDSEMESAIRRRQVIEDDIHELMKSGALETVDDGVYKAAITSSAGRSTTTIDPVKFKKHAGDQAFWACVKIGVTEAKEYVSEKEMARVGTVVAGKPGEPKLSVARIKKAK